MAKRNRTHGWVYILHFDLPYHHALHYVGWALELFPRLDAHARGKGARLMEVLANVGIGWQLVSFRRGTRTDERKIKNAKNTGRFCPICQGHRFVSEYACASVHV